MRKIQDAEKAQIRELARDATESGFNQIKEMLSKLDDRNHQTSTDIGKIMLDIGSMKATLETTLTAISNPPPH